MIDQTSLLNDWTALIGISIVVSITYYLSCLLSRARRTQKPSHDHKSKGSEVLHKHETIVARDQFHWRSTPPIKLRPWKPKYHLTMGKAKQVIAETRADMTAGVENITLNELLEFDSTYLDRIQLRRSLIEEKGRSVLAFNPVAKDAMFELHQYVFETYLPQRYPSMFACTRSSNRPGASKDVTVFHNLVTDEQISLPVTSVDTALRDLGSQIDTDFLFLLPSSTSADGQPIYHLEAYVTCFPAGFSTISKLSKPLAEIHTPVPGYAAKLERSMDRFFARIQVGQVVKRANWSINTDPVLFRETGSHFHHAEDEAAIQKLRDEIDVENCRVRCERQILHRLPVTKALVFSFKTYQYKLSEIKDEGNGEGLAAAIEGLSQGNVPEMNFYKRGVVWGAPVAEHLRR